VLISRLPEIFCFWAAESHDFWCRSVKHLAQQICRGNWASPWPALVLPNSENRRSSVYDELRVSGV
jgi:hypothetical protein